MFTLQKIIKHTIMKEIKSKWIPRQEVKDFFEYGQTTMASFSRNYNVRIKRIGVKVFYYREDIENLFKLKSVKK